MPPCRTVVRRRYAFSVPFAGPDTPTVIAINSTAPGLSVSSVSRHPFTSHRAIQVNPQEPAPGPEDSAVATSRAQEGDESETPTRELEADSTRPESAATSVSLLPFFFSKTLISNPLRPLPNRMDWQKPPLSVSQLPTLRRETNLRPLRGSSKTIQHVLRQRLQ